MTGESVYIKEHKQIIEGVIWRGTATDGAVNELEDTDIPGTYGDGTWKDERLFIFTGTGAGQTRKISGYDQGTRTFTVYDNWVTTPDTTSRYQVIAGDGTVGGAAVGDATAANQVTIITDTEKIFDVTLGASPIAGSLAAFIASGGIALGTQLPASKSLYDVIALDRLDDGSYGLLAIYNRVPSVSDVVLYPVAILAGTTEITDDGTAPAYYADAGKEDGTGKTADADPNIHWEQCISHFEREGVINVISIFLELRWEHKISGGGTAYSKIQMSQDGTGGTWVDVTDDIAETNAAYQDKTRIGIGLFLPTITAGASKLCFRLISWEPAGGAANDSSAKIRSDSYARITYRKS